MRQGVAAVLCTLMTLVVSSAGEIGVVYSCERSGQRFQASCCCEDATVGDSTCGCCEVTYQDHPRGLLAAGNRSGTDPERPKAFQPAVGLPSSYRIAGVTAVTLSAVAPGYPPRSGCSPAQLGVFRC